MDNKQLRMRIFRQMIGYFLLFLLCQIGGEMIVLLTSGEVPMAAQNDAVFAQLVLECVSRHPYACMLGTYCLLFVILLYKKARKRQIVIPMVPAGRMTAAQAVSGVVMGAAGCMWSGIVLELIARRTAEASPFTQTVTVTDPVWMEVLAIVIAAPLMEEILFRGAIYSRMRVLTRPLAAVLCQAAVYAAMYGDTTSMIWGFLFGVILGLSILRTEDLRAPVLIHIAYNTVTFLSPRFYDDLFSARGVTTTGLIVSGLLLAAAGVVFFREPRNQTPEVM